MLEHAPKNVVARGFLKALKAAARPIEQALDARVPVAQGHLKAARVTEITLDSRFRGGTVEIGYGKQGHVANFLEYGHRMVGHKPFKKHEGEVKPHPFMRPAAAAAAEAAITAFADTLADEVKGGILENVA